MIYLDYAANTPVNPSVLKAFQDASMTYLANPNANHKLGYRAKERIEEATRNIASYLDVKPQEVIYTSGATEANNLAIKGTLQNYKRNGKHIITTYLEHASVTSPIMTLQEEGYDIDFVDITKEGQIDLEHLKELLRADTVLVSISAIDSELGIIQPVAEIGKMLASYPNCFFHVDGTQAVGKIAVDLEYIDLFTFAPHKFYGLNGSGVLIKKEHVILVPQNHGGTGTTPYRSGSPALALIVATEEALMLAMAQMSVHYEYVTVLNTLLRTKFKLFKDVQINSSSYASPYILNISLRGISSKGIQKDLEEQEIYVATKAACSTPSTPSRPVYALTKDRKLALATLRMSFSHLTTEDELIRFLSAFEKAYQNNKK